MSSNLPTLFKKRNKVQQWRIWTEANVIFTEYGEVGGKLQLISEEILSGKNVGKKNETTKEQQAESEAKSRWNKKRDREGYKTEIVDFSDFLPMLAHDYNEHSEKLSYYCYTQPKLDGIRALASKTGKLTSRTNDEFVSCPYINKAIAYMNLPYECDGELYNHKLYKRDFETLSGFVRRKEPLPYDLTQIQYHIFDVITDEPFSERFSRLKVLEAEIKLLGFDEILKVVPTQICAREEDVDTWHSYWTQDTEECDYEGQILRNKEGMYKKGKRSYDLLKHKKFNDAEFRIVGVEEGKGKLKDCAIFILQLSNEETFHSKMVGSFEYLKELLINDSLWRGKKATVRYQKTTKYGIPRFGRVMAIRDYE